MKPIVTKIQLLITEEQRSFLVTLLNSQIEFEKKITKRIYKGSKIDLDYYVDHLHFVEELRDLISDLPEV